MVKSVGIFCGSSSGKDPFFEETTAQIAKLLSEKNIRMVYGGGAVGLMGKLTDATIQAKGYIIGVIPERLVDMELAHPGANEMIVVDSMHTRKVKIAELSDAFIALPGGMGTIEEITEMFTLTQLGYFNKPCILYNVNGYYDKFIEFMEHMVANKFMKQAHKDMMLIATTPQAIIEILENNDIEYVPKWQ